MLGIQDGREEIKLMLMTKDNILQLEWALNIEVLQNQGLQSMFSPA